MHRGTGGDNSVNMNMNDFLKCVAEPDIHVEELKEADPYFCDLEQLLWVSTGLSYTERPHGKWLFSRVGEMVYQYYPE